MKWSVHRRLEGVILSIRIVEDANGIHGDDAASRRQEPPKPQHIIRYFESFRLQLVQQISEKETEKVRTGSHVSLGVSSFEVKVVV